MKTILKILIALFLIAVFVIVGVIAMVRLEYKDKTYENYDQVPNNSIVVVLGASVYKDGTPSDALEDRLSVGADLWRQGKAARIILSGDDGRYAMPEIKAMVSYMYSQGVPDDVLITDGDNARTYDSCYRLKNEHLADNVVLITQGFHLPRALYLCNKLGLDAWGIKSDLRPYADIVWFTARDLMASLLAFWDIYTQALPTYIKNIQ